MSVNLILLSLVIAAWCAYVSVSPYSAHAKTLLVSGLALRLVGGLAYLFVIGAVYGGGDYLLYYSMGARQALWMDMGQWDHAWNSYAQLSGSLLDTQFIVNIVAVSIHLFGTSILDLFIGFSLVGYAGCVVTARAVGTVYGRAAHDRYLAVIMLFPSLWFWPSALGKDGLVLLGIGLAALGVARTRGAGRWLMLTAGVGIVFVVRPPQAAVLAFSTALAYTLASNQRWTAGRVVQVVGGLVVLVLALGVVGNYIGFSLLDLDSLDGYMTRRAGVTAYGGSSFELSGPTWSLPLTAFATVLFRPFLWETSGATALLTGVEVLALWAFVWTRRGSVRAMMRQRPRPALFWMGVIFLVLYGTLLGLSVGNFGTLVRQRVHIYPFLFLFLMLTPAVRRVAVRVRASVPRTVPM